MDVSSLLWVVSFLVLFLTWQTIFYRVFRGHTLLLATVGALILVAFAIVVFMVHSLYIELSFVPIVGVWYVMVYKKMKTL